MKQLNTYIVEKLKIDKNSEYESELDKEMKEWNKRMQSPFGQTLKELQCAVIDLGLYPMSTDEYGLTIYSPFDNYVTAYALDGNNSYTYKKIEEICDDYEYSNYTKIKKLLKKLESLI